MIVENFHIYSVQLTGKCIWKSKLNLGIFTYASQGRSLPQFLIITPHPKGNDSSPRQAFFQNLFPPTETAKETMKNQISKVKISSRLLF